MKLETTLAIALTLSLIGCSGKTMTVDSAQSPPSKSMTPAITQLETPLAQESQDSGFLIVAGERMGNITKDSTEESLREEYGEENVQPGSVYVGEGVEMDGLTIYPNDESKRVQLVWTEEAPKRVQMIRIEGDVSDWKTAEGVSLGSTLKEVQAINGNTFDLNGLEWDFGGFVTDWNGGKLKGLNLRFGGSSEELTEEEMQAILGDQTVKSDDLAMQKADPKVFQIMINFPPE